jgi:hypothetical protein
MVPAAHENLRVVDARSFGRWRLLDAARRARTGGAGCGHAVDIADQHPISLKVPIGGSV